jgi:hypothetical protein
LTSELVAARLILPDSGRSFNGCPKRVFYRSVTFVPNPKGNNNLGIPEVLTGSMSQKAKTSRGEDIPHRMSIVDCRRTL